MAEQFVDPNSCETIVQGFCPVCFRDGQPIGHGLKEKHCKGCDSRFREEDTARIVRRRRVILGLSRDEMASQTNVSPDAVKNYENRGPSKSYLLKTEALIFMHFKGVK